MSRQWKGSLFLTWWDIKAFSLTTPTPLKRSKVCALISVLYMHLPLKSIWPSIFDLHSFSSIHMYTDMQSSAKGSLDDIEQQIYSMSSFSGVHSESESFTSQVVNCHAVVCEGELCARVNTVPAYLEINRLVCQLTHMLQWPDHISSSDTRPPQ